MKALIRVTRRTEYASIVKMSQQEYDTLAANLRGRDREKRREAEKELNRMIDVNDWQDDDLHSIDEFEPFVEEGEGEIA